MKTAEILIKTQTFREAEKRILRVSGKIVQVDIPLEYGKSCLLDQIEKKGALCLSLDEEIHSTGEFILWLNAYCKDEAFTAEIEQLYESAAIWKWMPAVRRYLISAISARLVKKTGEGGIISVSGLSCLKARDVRLFVGRLLKKMSEKLHVIVWLDSGEQENEHREIIGEDIVHVSPGEMLLSDDDVGYLLAMRLPDIKDAAKEMLIRGLADYFGGLPAGICYAIDRICENESYRELSYLCDGRNHPLYESYGRNCLAKRLTTEELGLLKKLAVQNSFTRGEVWKLLRLEWADAYLELLSEKGILLHQKKEDGYILPGVFREYLLEKPEKKMLHEYQQKVEAQAEAFPGKICVSSFGPFLVQFRGRNVVWRTKKTKELFAFLFNRQGKPVDRDTILGNLWPELGEEKARSLFYTTMTYLRKNLKEAGISNLLVCQKGIYRFDMQQIHSDYQQLLRLKEQLDQENWAEAEKTSELQQICGESYLEFCSEEWTLVDRAYAERILRQCLRMLAAYLMRIGKTAQAIEYIELFRKEEPYAEDMTTMLISAYGKQGDYKKANQVYQEYRSLYLQEFGEEPGSAVQKAWESCRKEKK